ncbi:uncharacterized protein LOC136038558 [Artemia franciscana]|uniref:Uncharacterized protein n=1 Tax=Artemia franciscana TaxID=6661 RepID=A0AA88LA47_ARTSF|nr:hypothetical protein QYM36_006619 [Artemia franciscana]
MLIYRTEAALVILTLILASGVLSENVPLLTLRRSTCLQNYRNLPIRYKLICSALGLATDDESDETNEEEEENVIVSRPARAQPLSFRSLPDKHHNARTINTIVGQHLKRNEPTNPHFFMRFGRGST